MSLCPRPMAWSSRRSRRLLPTSPAGLRPQILRIMGLGRGTPASVAEYRAYYGGLRINTSLDLSMQRAAEQAIAQDLPSGPGEPTASLVTIDNKTGEVRAMVGGPIVNGVEDYQHHPFNLATQGHRQPGSSFKPFTLAVALESGIGPDSVWASAPQDFIVPNSARQGALHRPQLRQHLLGLDDASGRHRRLRQLGVRPGGHQGRYVENRASGPADGHPLAGIEQLRDDPRRPQRGRVTARHGARV